MVGENMIITYNDSNYYNLLKCGVPKSVLASEEFDLVNSLSCIEMELENKVKKIRSSSQVKVFEATLKLVEKPYLYVISGKTDAVKSKKAALCLLDTYLTKQLKTNKNLEYDKFWRPPVWHSVYANLNDSLRDRPPEALPGFLVLETLYPNSTVTRLDKIRDLLSIYSSIPRVIVGAGDDPINLCREQLYCMPNKVLYFEDTFELQVQEI